MSNAQGFASSLEADLRALSADARRKSAPVKEAAERGILKLRSKQGSLNATDDLTQLCSEEILKPFLLACDSKQLKLVVAGLSSLQRMISHNAVPSESMPIIIKALRQHGESVDESVQLKTLQTVLTILQSIHQPTDEEGTAAVLGICFRLLANSRSASNVSSTAGATLRQAVGLIFERIVVEEGLSESASIASTKPLSERYALWHQLKLKATPTTGALPRQLKHCTGNSAKSAVKLLEDLCALASGGSASWLHCPPLSRSFALDILEYVLAHHPDVFLQLAEMYAVLKDQVITLLIMSMRSPTGVVYSASGTAVEHHSSSSLADGDANDPVYFRLLLRIVATVTRNFAIMLTTESEVFLTKLLTSFSAQVEQVAWQRLYSLEALRVLAQDPFLVGFFFESYDMREKSTKVVLGIVQAAAKQIKELFLDGSSIEESLPNISQAFKAKASGSEFTPDMELLREQNQAGYLGDDWQSVVLALDILLGMLEAVEKLSDCALTLQEQSASSQEQEARSPSVAACKQLINDIWEETQGALYAVLTHAEQEALVVELLRGYQNFTSAAGLLNMVEPRDAFLGSLCTLTLVQGEAASLVSLSPSSSMMLSPTASGGNSFISRQSSTSGANVLQVEKEQSLAMLTPKNVQAIRTLLNVAQRLEEVLGDAWVMILETIAALERTLHSPHASTQDGPSTGASLKSDLDILHASSFQLFASSKDMSDEAVKCLLDALRQVSVKELRDLSASVSGNVKTQPTAPGSTGSQVRVFAIARAFDVVVHNTHRLEELWGLATMHLMDALSSTSGSVRAACMDVLDKALTTLMTSEEFLHKHDLGQGNSNEDDCKIKHGERKYMDRVLLSPLKPIYNSSNSDGDRVIVLRMVLNVLQRCGENLHEGWSSILELLVLAAQGSEGVIPVAFQSVRLLVSDLLGNLPEELVKDAVKCVAAYAHQNSDINVALTSVGLLWNTADYFHHLRFNAADHAYSPRQQQPEAKPSSLPRAVSTFHSEQFQEELEAMIFHELRLLCIDQRPEMRNSGLRTFMSALSSQGSKLPVKTWKHVVFEILLPMLQEIRQRASQSSAVEQAATELGKGKVMLVHHSRNTEQKQWDETLVLLLGGLSRLMRSFTSVLQKLDGFDSLWETFLEFAYGSTIGGSKEVACAAVSGVILFFSSGNENRLVGNLWQSSITMFTTIADQASQADFRMPQKARLDLLTMLTELYRKSREHISVSDIQNILHVFDKFALTPVLADETKPPVDVLPQVQRLVLDFILEQLAPLKQEHERVWSTVFHMLEGYTMLSCTNDANAAAESGKQNGTELATSTIQPWTNVFIRQSLLTLTDLYCEKLPQRIQAKELGPLLQCLDKLFRAQATTSKGATRKRQWQHATRTLIEISKAAVYALPDSKLDSSNASPIHNKAHAHSADIPAMNADEVRMVWQQLQVAYHSCLTKSSWRFCSDQFSSVLNSDGGIATSSSDDSALQQLQELKEELKLEEEALTVLVELVIAACPHESCVVDMIATLDALLHFGQQSLTQQKIATVAADKLCPLGVRLLLWLCETRRSGEVGQRRMICAKALPILLGRCDAFMRSFMQAERSCSSEQPMPKYAVDIFVQVLQGLEYLQLDAVVAARVVPDGVGVARAARAARSDSLPEQEKARVKVRTHLLLLYGAMVECVGCRDPTISELLQRLLRALGDELGLPH